MYIGFCDVINALSEQGGGHLVVPAGVWLTGPIVLKSNIDLHLEKGAVILFSPDVDLYPLVETVFEGLELPAVASLRFPAVTWKM